MGFLRDAVLGLKHFEQGFENMIGLPGNEREKKAQKIADEQLYHQRKQSEITEAELNRVKAEKVTEKRKIDAKRIRGLRGHFGGSGFLDDGASSLTTLSDTTGG